MQDVFRNRKNSVFIKIQSADGFVACTNSCCILPPVEDVVVVVVVVVVAVYQKPADLSLEFSHELQSGNSCM